jgi:hypothetical protein
MFTTGAPGKYEVQIPAAGGDDDGAVAQRRSVIVIPFTGLPASLTTATALPVLYRNVKCDGATLFAVLLA